ncbi:MAG TPA: hypothetical protein VGH85_09240 [Mycobacteriales bacterium]|jgi:hypothetical protein
MDPDTPVGASRRSVVDVGGLVLGAASLTVGLLRQARPGDPADTGGSVQPAPRIVDAAIGLGIETTELAWRGVGAMGRAARPLVSHMPHPTLPAAAGLPLAGLSRAADRGRRARIAAEQNTARLAGALIPRVVTAVLDQLDLTGIVLDHVDLDGVVEEVDIDAAVARVDIDRIVRRVDIDAIAASIDVDRIVRRVDIDAIIDRVDIDAIVSRVDIDAVAARISIDAIVDRVDIDAIVDRVDVDAVAAKLDMDAVIDRIDIVGIARYVVDALDLPEIIRQSTGVMTSDAVREVRLQGIQADEMVGRAVDRLLLRRRARRTDVAGFTIEDQNGDGAHPPEDLLATRVDDPDDDR